MLKIVLSLLAGILQAWNSHVLKKAGRDEVLKENLEGHLKNVQEAKKIDNSNDSDDAVRERLRNNESDK